MPPSSAGRRELDAGASRRGAIDASAIADRALDRSAEPTAILIRTPNWLGDLVVSTGFVAAVMQRFPNARVDLIVRAGFETLPLPQRGRVLPFDRKAISAGRFGRTLRGAGYTHCFLLPPSFSSAWMAWRAGIPRRIGFRGEGRSALLRPSLRRRHPARSVHLLQEYLDLLAPWFGTTASPPPDAASYPPRLDATPAWRAEHRLRDVTWRGRPVVLAPGAEYGPAKQWPVTHYRELARAIADLGWEIAVVGLPSDRALGDEIVRGIAGTGAGAAINLCGATTLPQLTALLADAALLVSNDSGAMHLAAALGTPQLALFGSTNPTWTAPLNPHARVLTRQEWCSPCYDRVCRFGHTHCLTELLPVGVIEEAERLLLAAPKGPIANT
jgi:heptosyltransferase II